MSLVWRNDFTSSSESDSDNEIVAYITRRRRSTNIRNDQYLVEDTEFLYRYRITKETATFIGNCIKEKVKHRTQKNNALSVSEQLLLTLRFYATCSFQQVLGDIAKTHKATVCRAIHRVSRAIASLAPHFIFMPRSDEEMARVSYEFYNIAHFPRVIGALDCTHVPIQSPGGSNPEQFRCRKGYFSLNVQTVVDARLKIMDIVSRWPGSCHDSTIFDNSNIKQRMENREFSNRYLLGDGGYQQRDYLMIPFRSPQNNSQELYNRSHIKTRNTVERCYGVWKRRFPCVGLRLRVKLERMEAIIVASAVMHNICLERNEPELEYNQSFEEDNYNDHYGDFAPTRNGESSRNALVENVFSS